MAADSAVWDAGGPTPGSSKFECGNRELAHWCIALISGISLWDRNL
jgi:hypothetical protein